MNSARLIKFSDRRAQDSIRLPAAAETDPNLALIAVQVTARREVEASHRNHSPSLGSRARLGPSVSRADPGRSAQCQER